MHRCYRQIIALVAFFSLLLFVSCQEGTSTATETGSEAIDDVEGMESQGRGMEHSDHDPKHGGIFFMALDEVHHLEGALTFPAMFRVYLYDAMTMPLNSEAVKETAGTVHWGEFPDPPGIPLKVGNGEGMLMAELDWEIEFPVTFTLLVNFPGAPEGASELFNFTFDQYSQPYSNQEGMSHEGVGQP